MKNLSDTQQQIYDTIIALKAKYPQTNPTITQLAKLFGISKQGMNDHLMKMQLKGYVRKLKGVEIVK